VLEQRMAFRSEHPRDAVEDKSVVACASMDRAQRRFASSGDIVPPVESWP
jgi:hypothetical protein